MFNLNIYRPLPIFPMIPTIDKCSNTMHFSQVLLCFFNICDSVVSQQQADEKALINSLYQALSSKETKLLAGEDRDKKMSQKKNDY